MINENKILLYSSDGTPKKVIGDDLIGADIQFSETINTGQGEIKLRIKDNFDSTFYQAGDIVEYQIFNDEFKTGLNRYSGQIKGLRRILNSEGEFIELVVYGIFNFLTGININKTYSGNLNTVIDTFIADIGASNNITTATEILGSTFIKNGITSTTSVNVSVNSDMFTALVAIFEDAGIDFFIRSDGTIVEPAGDNIVLTAKTDGVEIVIDEALETEIKISNALLQDFYPSRKIVLQNVPDNVNLEGEVIQGIDYDELQTTLLLGTVLRFNPE